MENRRRLPLEEALQRIRVNNADAIEAERQRAQNEAARVTLMQHGVLRDMEDDRSYAEILAALREKGALPPEDVARNNAIALGSIPVGANIEPDTSPYFANL